MSHRRSKRQGFSILEILIAIAVITVAIFGTIAAIAFGLRASDLGRTNTFAIGVNRKVIELILGGNYQLPNTYFQVGALVAADMSVPYGTAPWRPLYVTGDNFWFRLTDFGYSNPASGDATKFVTEAPSYELHVFIEPVSTTTSSFDSRLKHIIATTRWRDKTGWKNIQTEAFSN
ncbi:prepilin-type N-terminal cleavage/methylation domain-containing protein [bacterium]|nr:prepilin-type N-terminal cleavage/methylation domain-containing protein [bacterium]